MDSSTPEKEAHDGELHLWQGDDWWVVKDVETGVTTQGRTREAALDNIDEAVSLFKDDIGREPTDEELR